VTFYDLASLAKPLVTAPLALEYLDLDRDRRPQLGFRDRTEPLTVRQLLSHTSGLPPWFPFQAGHLPELLAAFRGWGRHPLLCQGQVGHFLYSDLGYRMLAELLEQETGKPFAALGQGSSGLLAAPWGQAPRAIPDGQDAEAWRLACPELPFPPQGPGLPHDANARAGMKGHAGFGTDAQGMAAALERWVSGGFPGRMALDVVQAQDGALWGLGLQRALTGPGRFGSLLASLPKGLSGIHVLAEDALELPDPAPAVTGAVGPPSAFWYHLGYTGPALFLRPEDGLCIALLTHRLGPSGELLDVETLRARRWSLLERLLP